MAKHDQRILKFLNQNADRAPTITEMMTRLNISISDISDSLASLQTQGLISKKTDHQGIECWFPNGPQASPQQIPPMQVRTSHLAAHPMPNAPMPVQTPPMDSRYREDSRFGSGPHERTVQAPDPHPPSPKVPPVQVNHIPMNPMNPTVPMAHMAPTAPMPPMYPTSPMTPVAPKAPIAAIAPIAAMAEPTYHPQEILPQSEPSFSGSAPFYPIAQPSSRGIGILTFVGGLVLAVVASTWLGGRMAAKEIKKASANFVDKKALLEANTALNEFQEKTKTHVTALEAEVKQLTAQLATTKAAAESLQTTAAAKPAATDEAANAKGKAGKRTAAGKAKPAPVAKGKVSKSTAAANSIAKAAARGAAMKRKAAMARSTGSDYGSSESGSEESSASPSVPEPPGLEDLPPPPSD
ncbi:MAG: hypothetical protein ABIW76_07560 [Fibrobacteria bacterium]